MASRICFPALFLVAMTQMTAPPSSVAQEQPARSVNNQDEEIQFVRSIAADTDEFRVLRSGDKQEINRYVTEAIELKEAVAFELLPHVLKAVRLERGDARPMKYKDPDTGEMRYFLQVVCPEFQLPYIRKMLHTLDLPGIESRTGNIYYHVRMAHRDASEISEVIKGTVLSGEGFTFADDVTNTLYIFDSESDGELSVETIKFYDVPPPQVEIGVWIIESDQDDDDTLGLDWDAWKRSLDGGLTFNSRLKVSDTPPAGAGLFGTSGNFTTTDVVLGVSADALASFINYLVDEGKADVVTRTTLSALNHRPATLAALKRIPIFGRTTDVQGFSGLTDVSANEPGSANEFIEGTTGFGGTAKPGSTGLDPADPRLRLAEKSEGVHIEIFPSIFTESLTLEIAVTVNSLVGFTEIGAPIISERRAQTTVNVLEGQTIKLGSLDKTTLVNENSSIPYLGRIPVLGYLFGKKREVERRSRLTVFLTPRIKNNAIYSGKVLRGKTAIREYAPLAGDPVVSPNPGAGASAADMEVLNRIQTQDR